MYDEQATFDSYLILCVSCGAQVPAVDYHAHLESCEALAAGLADCSYCDKLYPKDDHTHFDNCPAWRDFVADERERNAALCEPANWGESLTRLLDEHEAQRRQDDYPGLSWLLNDIPRAHILSGAKRRWFIYDAYQAVAHERDKPVGAVLEGAAPYKVTFSIDGSLIETKRVKRPPEDRGDHKYPSERHVKPVGGRRGKITEYSDASRWRLQLRLAAFLREQLANALFITLTYPAAYPEPQEAKRQLPAFIKRIRRRWPQACVIWRMEFQERGAPHFHLLVLGVRFIPHQAVAEWWYEVVGSGDARHLNAGTEVRRVRSAKHAIWYIAKYMAKDDQSGQFNEDRDVGRFWGIEGPKHLYLADTVEVNMYGWQVVMLGRFMRGLINARRRATGKKPPPYQDHAIGRSRHWLCDAGQIYNSLNRIVEGL